MSKSFVIPISDDKHREIKIYCAQEGITMKELFIRAMEKHLDISLSDEEKGEISVEEVKGPQFDPKTGEPVI